MVSKKPSNQNMGGRLWEVLMLVVEVVCVSSKPKSRTEKSVRLRVGVRAYLKCELITISVIVSRPVI